MKKIYTLILVALISTQLFSQGDDCFNAVTLTIGSTCVNTAGSTAGLTSSIPGCTGNADDDGWYQFVATNTSHSITVSGSGYDAVLEVLSGTCSSLSFTTIACADKYFSGTAESAVVSGLTIGATYFIRVYDYAAGSGSGNFNICITNPPPPPSNNSCFTPINLTVGSTCVATLGNTYGATESTPGCTGSADDDVWFTFTANSYTQNIGVTGSTNFDAVLEVFEGNCSSLTSLGCMDNTFAGQSEVINVFGLNPGQTYLVRVYDYYNANGGTFNICVTGNSIGSTQPNDNPCSAIQFPPVTSDCNYSTFSTVGATNTGSGLAPTPASCVGGSGGAAGFTSSSLDVWFKITVPSNGNIYITPQPNQGSGFILDGSMALYSGSCGALTQIACSSDNSAYPGSANDVLPYIAQTGLTPGSTVYLRYWGFGSVNGKFGLCVQSPTNDNCSNALYICDIYGYSASTSAAYTADRPGTGAFQMKGNNESSTGTNLPNGTYSGGVFGYYGTSTTTPVYNAAYSSPNIDVNIENNSWIKFTAASPTVSLRVVMSDCWVGNYPSGGIQMQIFSSTGCSNFYPVSQFREGSTTFTVTATALTTGSDYLLMVDGFANDICNYRIEPISGVSLSDIKATPNAICAGQTMTLTAPAGATTYSWYPGGQTTQNIVVNPYTTQTYAVIMTGICGQKQTAAKTITISAGPAITANTVTICSGNSGTITASGASSYTWNVGGTTSSIVQSPLSTTNYTVRGTLASTGCTNQAVGKIIVNPSPTVALASGTTCQGTPYNLSASGANLYNWSTNQSGSSISVSPTLTTVYTVTGTAVSGCKGTKTATVNVLPLPTMTGSPTITNSNCGGSNGSITGVNITGTGTLIYSWTNSTNSVVGTSANLSGQPAGTYNLLVTNGNGCTKSFGPYSITNPGAPTAPTASASANVICEGNSINLFASAPSGVTYNWSGPNGFSSSIANPTIPNATPVMSGIYSVYTSSAGCSGPASNVSVTVNPLPIASASSAKPTYCPGETVSLFAGSATSYTWTGPGGYTSNVQNPTIATPQAGNYTLVVSNAQGCKATSTVDVVIYNSTVVSASASSNTVCVLTSFSLNASGGTTYAWTGPNGFASTSQNPSIASAVLNASGVYSVVITNSLGCSVTQTVPVMVVPNGVLASTFPSTYYGNAPLTVNFTNASIGVTTTDNFNWNFGNGNTSSAVNPNTVYEAGTYSVTLTVTDIETGCMDDTTLVIIVEGDLVIEIPNVFTPNGDGVNEVFSIKMTGAKSAEGFIYNRWGQLLYSWDALNTAWDGRALNGADCPDGTYFYLIKVIDKKDEKHEFQGHVTIAR